MVSDRGPADLIDVNAAVVLAQCRDGNWALLSSFGGRRRVAALPRSQAGTDGKPAKAIASSASSYGWSTSLPLK